ncbi:ATP-grasp fold amidoligase family protein [Mediterraneibacter gnavus]|uniref:ATP-grasp fold amidoligase family protein n=1 Tax=Mediterraneibacter gnavus TaxID=33038 RepID=UPI00232ABDE3|nr:ATP-grasp fold amidoligase family protein [Mediterraneibacter gnavus]MDB8711935.1 ATP-grasp fold amidoligase family protein [Mediterraneibacter gnavus]MDB8714971.1 ATP-grasp fold amidoligase family protein [Mediterraneibacter gnavus]
MKNLLKEKLPLIYQIVAYIKYYKKFIENKHFSLKIGKMSEEELKEYDASLYRIRQNRELDWNNLKTYTEKMQWAKLFDKDPRKTVYSDKYEVRKWIEKEIGSDYLIPLIGIWDNYSDIDWKSLPNQFVIKTNHGSGDAVIVRDKKNMTLAKKLEIRRKIKFSLLTDYSSKYCEMQYKNICPKIIVEKYLDTGNKDLVDYKFLCFDGKPYFCWVDMDRFTNHTRNVYDLEWNLQSWNQRSYGNYKGKIKKPENFDEMIKIATKLSKEFSHVRVDLYNFKGKIYFGEMTFTNGSGFEEIVPHEADDMLGNIWRLPGIDS